MFVHCEYVVRGAHFNVAAAKIILNIVTCAYDINAQRYPPPPPIWNEVGKKSSNNDEQRIDYKFWYTGLNCSMFFLEKKRMRHDIDSYSKLIWQFCQRRCVLNRFRQIINCLPIVDWHIIIVIIGECAISKWIKPIVNCRCVQRKINVKFDWKSDDSKNCCSQ